MHIDHNVEVATVLFVCYNNAGRSLMAESIFNSRASDRHIDAHAESAGLLGVGAVHPMILRCIEELGIPIEGLKPKQITTAMVGSAETIVGFGGINSEHTPIKFAVTEQWPALNTSGVAYGKLCAVRDEISRQVDELLDRLACG